MSRSIKQVFIELLRFRGSLATIANVSDHVKCISLDNQPYMTRPILTNLNPDKYN